MPFWSNLSSRHGAAAEIIDLKGELGNSQNSGSAHRGAQEMIAIIAGNTIDIYTKKEAPVNAIRDQQTVYWLPWAGIRGKGEITEATWEKINASNCNYFLTSKFTGCRFVVDDIGVSHVAYGAGNAAPGITTSAQRDAAEGAARLARGGRRRMSMTAGAGAAVVYQVSLIAHALVFGYKDASDRWAFRVYSVDNLGGRTWRTL